MSLRSVRTVGLALCLLGLAGCGGEKLVVLHGRLADNGSAWQAHENVPLQVIVTTPASEDGKVPGMKFSAPVGSDGTFTVQGGTGKGVPLGLYTFAVQSSAGGPGMRRPQPSWLADFADPEKSPLKYEVTADSSQRIVLDLGKKAVEREP
jgi:hypothetical protein